MQAQLNWRQQVLSAEREQIPFALAHSRYRLKNLDIPLPGRHETIVIDLCIPEGVIKSNSRKSPDQPQRATLVT